jgi:murein DD-endopeptidase MepM/ murein hydrolase activator NlpD
MLSGMRALTSPGWLAVAGMGVVGAALTVTATAAGFGAGGAAGPVASIQTPHVGDPSSAAAPMRDGWSDLVTSDPMPTLGTGAGLMAGISPGAADPRAGARWLWPLHPRPTLLRRFLAPISRYGRGHRGLDLAATPGQQVYAVDAGIVSHAATVAGRGTITVLHSSGLRSTYEPVHATVHPGERVARGQLLGVVEGGVEHCGGRPCVHLGALRGRDYLDPLPLLLRRVILLPLSGPPR